MTKAAITTPTATTTPLPPAVIATLAANAVFAAGLTLSAIAAFTRSQPLGWTPRPPQSPPLPPPDPHTMDSINSPPSAAAANAKLTMNPADLAIAVESTQGHHGNLSGRSQAFREDEQRGATNGGKQRRYRRVKEGAGRGATKAGELRRDQSGRAQVLPEGASAGNTGGDGCRHYQTARAQELPEEESAGINGGSGRRPHGKGRARELPEGKSVGDTGGGQPA